jgi:uncharacterized protein YbbC (DUF1343 family)
MRSLTAATLYPGVGLLEFCKLSVGRGTDSPFELLGAPYFDDMKLAAELNAAAFPGIRFVPVRFTPSSSVFANEECRGVRILLTDREAFRAADLGMLLATTLVRDYGEKVEIGKMATLLGDEATLTVIRNGGAIGKLKETRDRNLETFMARRGPYLLYPR